ncbi:MAG: RimK family alpha-L-glutamate ligase [Crenarchaeota archaeon]|nr:RimK family alpha-L-glutamate ligase [Thermoproteota archaeon]
MTRIGILTRNPQGWATQQLTHVAEELGHRATPFRFRDIIVQIGDKVHILVRGTKLEELTDIVLVRPIGKCSLEQAIYRMDLLHLINRTLPVVNSPTSIEIAIDKFRTLYLLALNGIKVPLTFVTENEHRIYDVRERLPRNVIIKPLFGSRGHGVFSLRLYEGVDYIEDLFWRIMFYLTDLRSVIYLQEQVSEKGEDYRLFVIDNRVIAGMVRKAQRGWKTNVSLGGRPRPLRNIPNDVEDLAVRACRVIGCEIAGVDILRGNDDELYVLEVNSQPGWRGLQECTRINIAREIINYLAYRARR